MKNLLTGSAAALFAMAQANPAFAEEADVEEGDAILVEQAPLHPAAGLMNEHMHEGGELMVGLRWIRERHAGANQSGTETVSDAEVFAAGYPVRAKAMTMDMIMLDLMYAPNDKVTFMVMPHWMRHEMTMVGIDPMSGMDMGLTDMGAMDMPMAHSMLGFGETMSHSSEGFGDTLVSASYRLVKKPHVEAHATLGVWVPTGSVSRTNADGTFVHYSMQGGSGTWDIAPSVTVSGSNGAYGWGAQAGYRWRTESANASGFAFGDEAMVTAWTSYAASSDLSLTARVAWEHEGSILGEYNAAHRTASPSDRQANYGGDKVLLAGGVNVALPVGGPRKPQIGIEAAVPVYQDLNGVQLPEDWRLSVSLSRTF